jgi:hypothetical protein
MKVIHLNTKGELFLGPHCISNAPPLTLLHRQNQRDSPHKTINMNLDLGGKNKSKQFFSGHSTDVALSGKYDYQYEKKGDFFDVSSKTRTSLFRSPWNKTLFDVSK